MGDLGECSKFTIQIANDEKTGTKTFLMDALSAFLRAHGDPQSEKVLAQLDSDDFDSVSVRIDLSLETGNICELRADIQRFLREFEVGGRSFATGINFEYHTFYEKDEETVDVEGF